MLDRDAEFEGAMGEMIRLLAPGRAWLLQPLRGDGDLRLSQRAGSNQYFLDPGRGREKRGLGGVRVSGRPDQAQVFKRLGVWNSAMRSPDGGAGARI